MKKILLIFTILVLSFGCKPPNPTFEVGDCIIPTNSNSWAMYIRKVLKHDTYEVNRIEMGTKYSGITVVNNYKALQHADVEYCKQLGIVTMESLNENN